MNPLSLINIALSGVTESQLTDFSEETSQGDMARAGYEEAVMDLLARHRWSFLMDDALLSNPESTSSEDFTYKFLIPEYMERVFSVQREPFSYDDLLYISINRTPVQIREYQYRGDNYIYSNYGIIYVAYMKNNITDVRALPAGFKKALIVLMKSHYALSFKKSIQVANYYSSLVELNVRTAISNDISQAKTLALSNPDPNSFRNRNYNVERF